jgi:hypothetical protein
MTKTIAKVSADTTVSKTVSHRAGNPATMLSASQATAPVTTKTAAAGRDAYRSALDSNKLAGDLDGPWDGATLVTSQPPAR